MLTRRETEHIVIEPAPGTDAATLAAALAATAVRITIARIEPGRVQLAIEAPGCLRVRRAELPPR